MEATWGEGRSAARRRRRLLSGLAAAAAAFFLPASGTQDAVANGDTRTLTLYHTHTYENATITFRRNGQYDEAAITQLNWFLRDWRVEEPAQMDPRLFDILWEVYREAGSSEPIHIVSAYRSPVTNSMLRNRSKGVSEHSQHMSGKAIDIRLPDVDTAQLRALAMRMQYGGVGYYPSASFVHIDTGSVRAWPRMSQDQLVQLFPNGRTLHLPASGPPLPGYEEARAEIPARNAALAAQTEASLGGGSITGFLTSLFIGQRNGTPAVESGAASTTPRTALAYAAPEGARPAPPAQAVPLPPRRPDAARVPVASVGIPVASVGIPVASVGMGAPRHTPLTTLPELAGELTPQGDLRALLTVAAADAVRPAGPRLRIARVEPRALVPGDARIDFGPSVLDHRFLAQSRQDLTVTRFAGPAVRPLLNLRYAAAAP